VKSKRVCEIKVEIEAPGHWLESDVNVAATIIDDRQLSNLIANFVREWLSGRAASHPPMSHLKVDTHY
jgi:hypothetical protein